MYGQNSYNYQYGYSTPYQQSTPIQQPTQVQQPVQSQVNQVQVVNNIEEVRQSSIDWSGNISYYQASNGESIFTKQLLNDGSTRVLEYKLNVAPKTTQTNENDNTLEERVNKLTKDFEKLKKELGGGVDVQ